jgi:hypothetical protein
MRLGCTSLSNTIRSGRALRKPPSTAPPRPSSARIFRFGRSTTSGLHLGEQGAQGSIVPNPHTDWTTMVVVQRGPSEVGKWIVEERNVYQDFIRAFSTEPLKISGVAIMTDTDNTKESATACYADIVFRKALSTR